jgi:hypothetical protein
VNGKEIEVMCNTKGFYHIRMLVDQFINYPNGERKHIGKGYKFLRINRKQELIEA